MTDAPAIRFTDKSSFTAVGLMSGTSMDGVDAALVRFDEAEINPRVYLIEFVTLDYPEELRTELKDLALGHEVSAENIASLSTAVGVTFAASFFEVCRRAGVEAAGIDFIGSHGQTVAHAPPQSNSGNPVSGTLQLGSPGIIAALTGVTTVGDFRGGDIALGGQGAPLTPYADFCLRRSPTESRVILNIGGIANVTYLPRACGSRDVLAFDTGPGNMVIDELFALLFPGKGAFDRGGVAAAGGSANEHLVEEFSRHPYFRTAPPKSAGHREFGAKFAWRLKSRADEMGLGRHDTLASAVLLTSKTIADAITAFVKPRGEIDAVYVSGGGTHNPVVIRGLLERLGGIPAREIDDLGIPADAKEAVDFAFLARETILGRVNVLPAATGAKKGIVLGSVARGGGA